MNPSRPLDPDKAHARAPEFPSWPSPTPDEIEAVARTLSSSRLNYWSGTEGRDFESEFAAATGCAHGVALINGSVALELALRAVGVRPRDDVIVTPRSFVASASCAVMVGARPVFADVDPESQNLTAATIEAVLTPRTKAVVAVHLAGWPCEMDSIHGLADAYGLKVIEDCAQAHGAGYWGRPAGSLGDAAAWSFCHDKIMTTGGEGGMLTTDDEEVWGRAWSFKDHGRHWDAVYDREHAAGFKWFIESFGTNWRMTEIQATLGRVQLAKLQEWVATRRRNASILGERFSRLTALRVAEPPAHIAHSYYKYYVFVRPDRLRPGWDRNRILSTLLAQGYPASVGVCPEIYREKAFLDAGLTPAQRLPVARQLGETSLMFLVHPTLQSEHMHATADLVEEVLAEAAS